MKYIQYKDMGLLDLFWKRDVEQRKTEDCYSYYTDALTFGSIYNNSTAMNLSAVFRATEIISDGIATLPIQVKLRGGKHKQIVNHYLDDVLKNQFLLKKLLIQSVILKGNGFAYIERNGDGSVKNLRFLESEDVTINYDKKTNTVTYYAAIISPRKIEAVNMIHLKKNTWDGIKGVPLLTYASRSLKISQNTENTAKTFFENGCNLSGVLTVQGQLTDKQKTDIKNSWTNAYAGGGNGLAVLQGNMKYDPIQLSASDSQMLESRAFNVQDIARFFGISPVLLGDLTHSSYATIEAVQIDFLTHTLQPYITMVEEEFNKKLLRPSESNFTINLDDSYVLKADKQAQANYYNTLLSTGVLCVNEVRQELGYGEVEGGDKHNILYVDTNKTDINNNNE